MRQAAITQLQRHLNAVLSKRPGQAVGLWGEPGVGKTFTVQTLLAETPCQSLSLHATTPDGALVLSLPRPPKRPTWTDALRERLTQGQAIEPQALVDTLSATLAALAPFVLHLEDIHEASPERLELIQKLAKAIPRLRGVGLLVTSRSQPPEPFKAYPLEALDQNQSDEMLRTQAKAELPKEGLAWVFERTGGNPLFALEFWRYLRQQGFFWSDGKDWHWKKPPDDFVPVSVEALILEMVKGLADSPSTRAVLEARALFGALQPSAQLWARVAQVDGATLTEAQQVLLQKGLLASRGFVHPLIGEVVKQEIPPLRKQGYARRALEMLEGSDPESAAEFIELADLEASQALPLIERAAGAAEARGDKSSQANWLAKAVGWSQEGKAARALQAAQALRNINLEQAAKMAEIAALEPSPNPEAVFLLAELQANQGLVAEAEQTLNRLPPTEEVKLRWWETRIWVRSFKSLWEEVVQLWNQHPSYQTQASPHARRVVGLSLVFLHRLDEAQAIVDELTQLSLSPLEQIGLLNLSSILQSDRGNLQAAVELHQQNLALCRSLGLIPNTLATLLNLSSTLDKLGARAQSQALLEEAGALAIQSGNTLQHAVVQMRLAIFLMDQGHFEQAETLMLESHALLQGYSNLTWRTENHLKQARLYLTWLPPHGLPLAYKHASAALEYARQTQDAKFLTNALAYLARTEALLGNPTGALRLAQEAVGLVQQKQHQNRMGTAWFAYGVALEANGRKPEALEAIQLAASQEDEDKMAQRFGLEADRLSKDLESARKRYDWFVEQGLHGLAQIALRYFPGLNTTPETPTQPASNIYLKVLGGVVLEQSGQPLSFRAKKRLELLCYLLEARIAGKSEVDLLELMDAFYPEMPEERAKLTLRQLIYLIRTSLGAESIHSTPNGYALGAIDSDVEDFLQTGDGQLWRGAYLQGFDSWNANVRDGLLLALRSSAGTQLNSNPAEAARLGQIWLEMEPYDGEALRLTLRALELQGKPKAAEQTYQQAKARLLEVGEALPLVLEDFLGSPIAS